MNDPDHDELARLSLRWPLTSAEKMRVEAYLAAHPHLRQRWEEDLALGRALAAMRNVPVSSNFTARVLQAVDRDQRNAERRDFPARWMRWTAVFKPKLSWAVLVLVGGSLVAYQYQSSKRQQFVRDVRAVSQDIAALPHPEVLEDFDVINQLRQVSSVGDDELLTALQ